MTKTIMFPTNQMSGYASEMNRLFSRHPENDLTQSANIYHHSFPSPYQGNNRSSSSADSTSPETFPDVSYFGRPVPDVNLRPILETPRPSNQYTPRRRPIVGRKILDTPTTVAGSPKAEETSDFNLSSSWHDDSLLFPNTPPQPVKNFFVEQKNYTRNAFYELFPERATETPQRVNMSPIMSNYSPTSSVFNMSPTNIIPRISTPNFTLPQYPTPPMYTPNYTRTPTASSSRAESEIGQPKMCSFCRKNGETPIVYLTHCVKEKVGNKHVVTCPILRSHVCSTCGASGDNAHTITYCPVLRSCNNGAPLRSTTVTLKNTRLKSNGRRRY